MKHECWICRFEFPGKIVKKNCEISIIMPVFNAAAFVSDAINSVLCQSFGDLELLAVNDGSSDESEQVLRSHRDSRLRIISQLNRGQSAAINLGVNESRGRFIKIVDADDWIHPLHLEAQWAALRGHSECVACCRWGYFRDDFRHPSVNSEQVDRDYPDPLEWIVDSLTRDEGMMGGWRWLIPRNVWDRSGGYDERLSLNNDFHASIAILLASSGVRFSGDAVYSYRKAVSGALSGARSRRAMESALLTTELGCRLLLGREDSPRIRKLCAVRFQRWLYEFYPEFPDLAASAESAVVSLGGATVPFPGGTFGRSLAGLIGWRKARQLQTLARRWGWLKILGIKAGLRNRRLR